MPPVDFQTLFNIVLPVAYFLGGWVVRNVQQAVKDLQEGDKLLAEKVNSIEILVAGQYVTKSDYRDDMREVKDMLRQIDSKLDGKADKN